MNRKNIWIHICIAAVAVSMAAILGQINRWEKGLNVVTTKEPLMTVDRPVKRSAEDGAPEVLVKFRPNVSAAQIQKIVSANNDRIEDILKQEKGWVAIDDLDNRDAKTVAEQYAQMTDIVLYAEPNSVINLEKDPEGNSCDLFVHDIDENHLDALPEGISKEEFLKHRPMNEKLPNDPQFEDQWALYNTGQEGGKAKADIHVLEAWKKNTGSDKVVVAVLDSGVDYTHQDLAANMWFRPDNVPEYQDEELGTFNDEHGFDAADNASDPMDDNGHGTHCAGIIGAEGDNDEGIAGVNWNVSIMPLKFLGRGGFGTTKDAIESINYAIDRKQHGVNVRVINASWGSTSYSKALEDAIKAAGDAGILFVAAAGNNGTNNDNRPHYPSNYDLPNVISVAATDRNDQLTSFSNFGVKTVHIAAPGKDILSTWLGDDYREASGTSMATPQVAGVAALILANEPNLTVAQLRERLLKSVDKCDSLKGKVESGGRLDAAKAVGN